MLIEYPEGKRSWVSTVAVDFIGGGEILSFESYASTAIAQASPTPTAQVVVRPSVTPLLPSIFACAPSTTPISGIAVSLAPEIPAVQSRTPRLSFFQNDVTLPFSLTGSELICLSSTLDGRGQILVDDALELRVTHQDGSSSAFTTDFYDKTNGTITPKPPQDVSRMFVAGTNIVRINLRDSYPSFSSTSQLYLTIWRP